MKQNKKTIVVNCVIIGVMLVVLFAFTVFINNMEKPVETKVYSYVYWDAKKENLVMDFLNSTVLATDITQADDGDGNMVDIFSGDIIELTFVGNITLYEDDVNYLRAKPTSVVIKQWSAQKTLSGDVVSLTFTHQHNLEVGKTYMANFFEGNAEKPSYSAVIDWFTKETITIKYPKDESVNALKAVSVYRLEITENEESEQA